MSDLKLDKDISYNFWNEILSLIVFHCFASGGCLKVDFGNKDCKARSEGKLLRGGI